MRWRTVADAGVSGFDTVIDDLQITGGKLQDGYICAAGRRARVDYDGDGKTDFAVFRPSNNVWYVQQSTAGFTAAQWGATGDRLVPADYDRDNKADFAVFRDSYWFIRRSTDGQFQAIYFGLPTDVPVPGDYDGDGAADAAVFRAGNWYVQGFAAGFNAIQFGLASDIPIPKVFTK